MVDVKYTFVEVTDWCGLWRGELTPYMQDDDASARLIYEGHSLSVRELARHTDQDGEFYLEVIDGEGKQIDESVGQTGGFDGFSLVEVRKQAL